MTKYIIIAALLLSASIGVFSQDAAPVASCQDPVERQIRAEFRTLDPQTKVDIWLASLKKRIETRSLNKQQWNVVARAVKLLNADLYQTKKDDAFNESDTGKQWATLLADMKREFSQRDNLELFGSVDPDVFRERTQTRFFTGKVLFRADGGGNCDCAGWWGCTDPYVCNGNCGTKFGCVQCVATADGCGPFWVFACDGGCRPA